MYYASSTKYLPKESSVKVLREWSTQVVCNSCGVMLEIEIDDVKVRLVDNYGQIGDLTADQIPEYFIKCGGCKLEIMIQKGFSGKLPIRIKRVAEKMRKRAGLI